MALPRPCPLDGGTGALSRPTRDAGFDHRSMPHWMRTQVSGQGDAPVGATGGVTLRCETSGQRPARAGAGWQRLQR